VLLLTLPGTAFIYQGDEIGMIDGAPEGYDVIGRDAFRHPMQWNAKGGFTTGTPWLSMTNPAECNVADNETTGNSILNLYRELISLRRGITGPVEEIDCVDDLLVYRRGDHIVACNLGNATHDWNRGKVIFTTGIDVAVVEPRTALIATTL
jgi:alpha-glucosidase